MKIMVSACLAGENCKYNGGNNRNKKVEALFDGNEIIPVCPEVMGGLPTPRAPSEIVHGIVINKEGFSTSIRTNLLYWPGAIGRRLLMTMMMNVPNLPDRRELHW